MQAPWTLSGNGFMILFKFSKDWVEKNAQVPDFLKGHFSGHFASLMLVNYETSAVGPYKELLFIPGKFHFKGEKYQSISRIYVSSEASVEWGRRNWGIPKFYADFNIEKINDHQEKWTVSIDQKTFFEIEIAWQTWRFPITTALVPIKVIQENFDKKNAFFLTAPHAKGKGSFAKILSLKIHEPFFPNVENCKPLATLRVSDFQMTFPVAIPL